MQPLNCLRRLWALLVVLLVSLPSLATTGEALRIGLLPTVSARTLITNYQPLRIHLERELQRPVTLLTAPDFQTFHRDTAAGQFDLVVTAAHLARLAQIQHGMQPLATYRATNRAILVTARSRPVRSPQELRGHKLAIFDPLALVVLNALQWLGEQGLQTGRDYQVLDTPSHNSVAHSVTNGESLMGVTAPAGMRQFSPDLLEKIQVHAELPPVPALIWVAHPRVGAQAERIKSALLRFPDTPESQQFLAVTAYQGLREVGADELRSLDPYAREIGRLLRHAP
jgi:phosphonate transport system substrate-binding protein